MARIRLTNVQKRYENGFEAVKDMNLEIEDKEFLVLVGPSGCGKSTTLRMVAGLEEISSGEVYIGERLVNHLHPKDRHIAMVFQNYALYPHMSVYDNMSFGLRMRKAPKSEIDPLVREAAAILGITDLLDRKPRQLSGGQRQRVALGRAIVRKPDVFLFDEPLSNLDAKLRTQMRIELIKLHERLEATSIYVTHDQVEAMTMGSKIVVLKDGVIQQVGPPMDLYNKPVNRFVAGFIGNPPMNFVECRFLEDNAQGFLAAKDFRLRITDDRRDRLKATGEEDFIMGIRPEGLTERKGSSTAVNTLSARVNVIETLGREAHVEVVAGGTTLTSIIDPRINIRPHQDIELEVDMERIHVFRVKEDQLAL
jgi:multiple sugar transport system ATP-binding protein